MSKSRASTEPASFEAALTELETMVQRMEVDPLSLEDSLSAYQRGTELLRYCRNALNAAEQRIQVLEDGAEEPIDSTAAGTRKK